MVQKRRFEPIHKDAYPATKVYYAKYLYALGYAVAKLAAFGMSNQEIADKLHISLSVVKQAVRVVSEKSGMPRSDFAAIL